MTNGVFIVNNQENVDNDQIRQRRKIMSTGKFLAGFIVGGVVGSVMGLLLAPQSGEETREMLAKNSEELCNKAEKTVKEIQSKAEDIVSDMQKKGDDIMDKIQGLINSKKEEV